MERESSYYDHRLASIGTGTQFRCDGRDNRLSVTCAAPWGNLLATWDGTGLRKYIYGKGLIAMQTGSARYCYHFDPTGSTAALTDMSGSVVKVATLIIRHDFYSPKAVEI